MSGKTKTCPECNGSGWENFYEEKDGLIIEGQRPCSNCGGSGKVPADDD